MAVSALALNPRAVFCDDLIAAPPLLCEQAMAVGYGGRIAALLNEIPFMHRIRKPGEYLFRAGDSFHSLYVLHSGFARTYYASADGREQTTGLHLRGDILGLDAVASGTHGSDALVLDECNVLTIPYKHVIQCSRRSPQLVRELYEAFSAEIRRDRDMLLNMHSLPAAGRVAAFLLEMSRRFASRGFSATQLQMRLTRQEIGSMLGLELETVSRAFSRFARLGLITVCLRQIVLVDIDGLQDIVAQPQGEKRGREGDGGRHSLAGSGRNSPLAVAVCREI
jgi:CRP/FNR family transcriptional regulator, anaerobic regulatory protein